MRETEIQRERQRDTDTVRSLFGVAAATLTVSQESSEEELLVGDMSSEGSCI